MTVDDYSKTWRMGFRAISQAASRCRMCLDGMGDGPGEQTM